MRRLNLVFLTSLQLVTARQHAFSPYDDVLAHPQFEVVFSDTYIREADALALVDSARTPNPTYAADFSSQTDLTRNVRESAAAEATTLENDANGGETVETDGPQVSESFEIIRTPHLQYLCSVPVIAPPPTLNQTATELAKAEEARELSRASAKGWELMSGLEGTCLYYMSGWWSYSFCYGKDSKEIVQFHALPGLKNGLPERDPESHEYVLGTTNIERTTSVRRKQQAAAQAGKDNTPATEGAAEDGSKAVSHPPNTDLQVKGDQRYLVHKFEHGTICDLTGRPRTIEVQYHCSPGSTSDRIGWIKEVTTCTYLMVVQTPRLCLDVAFLPPKETRAHPISCRQIVSSDEELDAWRDRKTIEAAESMAMAEAKKSRILKHPTSLGAERVTHIGGILIGGHRMLGDGSEDGKPPARIKPPNHIAAAAAVAKTALSPLLEAVKKGAAAGAGDKKAAGEGTDATGTGTGADTKKKVQILTVDELEQAGLDPETVEEFRKELKKMAQDSGLFMVEHFDPEEEADEGDNGQKKVKKAGGKKGTSGKGGNGNKQEDEEEGSREVFFKEEL
ncbi:glucosidase II beta subunit-like protein-domain-containing protein [Rhypophila decipiens]|uniref:Endoplasmic reticulum lectin n=1 Tax=Rhypophila decipiens TaxID=261697 RepID=A0AAN6Y2F9_9PEZI|nr:glucosidase II beta subunit-like protein-domain-containing protein [Rhypophila decipiens]